MPQKKISLTIGAWRFSPSIRFTIITLIAFALLVYLGYWQLQRAKQKKKLQATIAARTDMLPVNITTLTNPSLINDRYTPVIVEGVFLNQYTFLLDNQMYNHQPGFRVLTPIQVPDLDRWVIIDRGWIPQGTDRSILPQLEPIYGLRKIIGQIDSISSGIILKKDKFDIDTQWPVLIQSLDYELMQKQLNHLIYNFTIRLNSNSDLAFKFANINKNINPNKNIMYALQWFSFAILLFIYYLFMQTKRITKDD